MLDIKLLREETDRVKKMLLDRGDDFDLDVFTDLDSKRRGILQEVEKLKQEQNSVSKQIPIMKKEGKDISKVLDEMKVLSDRIKEYDADLREVEENLNNVLLSIPNMPHPDVPAGKTDEDNVEIRKFGEPKDFDYEPKAHWDLGEDLDILDFKKGAEVTGARFVVYKGLGARLERALMNFMLDLHTSEHGYTEILPPFMVNQNSMVGTGQLPKFEEDTFKVKDTDYYLIPTAEVPVTNMYKNQILDGNDLPLRYCAYSACFRAEAGSAGRDTRGIIRQHQFNKVELVKFTKPEDSYEELERLTSDAEEVLKKLNIPYRVVRICMGDLGFTAALKYDIEVWMPSYNKYVEISSCSNFESFQARRANIKYRNSNKEKAEFVHTINGSGLAVGRCTAAVLENCQQEDGSIIIPQALVPYMGGVDKIEK
ncbi:MAG: serine--tRNA ligase [Epulopiscium sp.]|nr:serine--tRNA ligase [Candidatus Epulonipiscium sp.]